VVTRTADIELNTTNLKASKCCNLKSLEQMLIPQDFIDIKTQFPRS